MGALDELALECQFYAAVHELAIVAWRKGLTVEALLALADAVDPLSPPVPVRSDERSTGEPR